MRQVNMTGYEQHFMVWPKEDGTGRDPFSVAAGEETDFPELLAGFVAVEEPAPKVRRKDAAAAANSEEGEPQ